MRQLLVLGPKEIQTGIWKIGKAAGLIWDEGNNIVFRDLGFRRTNGADLQSVPLIDQARHIVQAYVDGTRRAYFGTDVGVESHTLSAGVWSRRAIHTWPTAGQYASLETWGAWLLATNGVDPVAVWRNASGPSEELLNTPFHRAKIIKRKLVYLLAFNTDNIGDTGVEWSKASDIEFWDPYADGSDAGNLSLRDLESEIVAVADLGDRLAVYSRSSMSLGTFVGTPNTWGFKRAVKGIGAVSAHSVVTVDPFNYGLTQDGIWKTDGNSFMYVDEPAMNTYIKDTADFSRASVFWGFHDTSLKCVTFSFLDSEGRWKQVSYYYETGLFTKSDLQLTAGGPKEVFDFPVVAGEGLQMGFWQGGTTHFGEQLTYSLQSKPLDFGDRSVYKVVQLIRVDGQWDSGNLRVRAHTRPEDEGKIIFDKALAPENYFDYDAPYFSVEFYGAAKMYISGIEFFGIPGGIAL